MKVALFGGAFDPPHIGHQRIAREMISHSIVDEVWYVPVYKHPWEDRLKKWHMVDYSHRKKMVEMILSPQTYLHEYLDVSFTYPTLLQFSKDYPEYDFSWIIGADNLLAFRDWDYYREIINEFGVHVYPRKGFKLETDIKGMNLLDDFTEVVVSSTMVREFLKKKDDIIGLVGPKVAEYIKENSLYHAKS